MRAHDRPSPFDGDDPGDDETPARKKKHRPVAWAPVWGWYQMADAVSSYIGTGAWIDSYHALPTGNPWLPLTVPECGPVSEVMLKRGNIPSLMPDATQGSLRLADPYVSDAYNTLAEYARLWGLSTHRLESIYRINTLPERRIAAPTLAVRADLAMVMLSQMARRKAIAFLKAVDREHRLARLLWESGYDELAFAAMAPGARTRLIERWRPKADVSHLALPTRAVDWGDA